MHGMPKNASWHPLGAHHLMPPACLPACPGLPLADGVRAPMPFVDDGLRCVAPPLPPSPVLFSWSLLMLAGCAGADLETVLPAIYAVLRAVCCVLCCSRTTPHTNIGKWRGALCEAAQHARPPPPPRGQQKGQQGLGIPSTLHYMQFAPGEMYCCHLMVIPPPPTPTTCRVYLKQHLSGVGWLPPVPAQKPLQEQEEEEEPQQAEEEVGQQLAMDAHGWAAAGVDGDGDDDFAGRLRARRVLF